MLKLFLCLRYLRKKKIVFLSIAAVALSVSLLIVVASLFTGFIKAVEQAATVALGDVVLFSPPEIKFTKYPLLIERLEQTKTVEAATATLGAPGLLRIGTGNIRPVHVIGIEPGGRDRVTGLKKFLLKQKDVPGEPSFRIEGSPEKIGGFVGIAVLSEPNEQTDEYDLAAVENMLGMQIILTTGTESDSQIKRKLVPFSIADVVETGVYQFDKAYTYLPIEELQRRLYANAQVADQLHIKLADNTDTDTALAVIGGVWRNFVEDEFDGDTHLMYRTAIITSNEMQRDYIAAYQKQMGILLVIFGVVSLGVVLLIFCIFYMIVRLKQKDIAIIRSCGMARTSVALVFVNFGLCVGVIGSIIGAILGWLITINVNTIEEWISIVFGLKLWKSSVYLFSSVPNEVNWSWALLFMVAATAAAAVGTLIPAVVAAITKPVNILQYE